MKLLIIAIGTIMVCGLGCLTAYLLREGILTWGVPSLVAYAVGLKWAWNVTL